MTRTTGKRTGPCACVLYKMAIISLSLERIVPSIRPNRWRFKMSTLLDGGSRATFRNLCFNNTRWSEMTNTCVRGTIQYRNHRCNHPYTRSWKWQYELLEAMEKCEALANSSTLPHSHQLLSAIAVNSSGLLKKCGATWLHNRCVWQETSYRIRQKSRLS